MYSLLKVIVEEKSKLQQIDMGQFN